MNGAVRPYFPHRAHFGEIDGAEAHVIALGVGGRLADDFGEELLAALESAFRGVVVSFSSAAQVTRHALMNARNALLLMGALRFVSVIARVGSESARARESESMVERSRRPKIPKIDRAVE